MRGLSSCSARRTYKVITSLPNSTISIKNVALVEFSSGAYFFCLRVFYHSAKLCFVYRWYTDVYRIERLRRLWNNFRKKSVLLRY